MGGFAKKFGKIGYSILGAVAPALNAIAPGVGSIVSSLSTAQAQKIDTRQQESAMRKNIRAQSAGFGAMGQSSIQPKTSFNLGGILGGIGLGGMTRPTSSVISALSNGQDEEEKRASLRADEALSTLVQGGGDDDVRRAARKNKASKKDLLMHLRRVEMVDMTRGADGGEVPLSAGDKFLLSNEIERIFRTKRRSAGGIPKSVARFIEKGRTLARLFQSAPRLVSAVKGKGRFRRIG